MISPTTTAGSSRAGTTEAVQRPLAASDPAATRAAFARLLQRLGGQASAPTTELEQHAHADATPMESEAMHTGTAARAGDGAMALRTLVEYVAAPSAAVPARTSPVLLMPTAGPDESVREPSREPSRERAPERAERTERTRRSDGPVGGALANALTVLDPAFRTKVEHVIARMREEHGREVTVTETYRSQRRQDDLYEQGRTRPGAVVTWTRQSRHGEGLAADLKVNGTWNDPEGYALLQQVAQEEGLVTLGAKDPGHLEMAADDALGALGKSASIMEAEIGVQRVATTAGVAGARSAAPLTVAQVAAVARVAQVALVATVAQVAPAMSGATVNGAAALTTAIAAAKAPVLQTDVAPAASGAGAVPHAVSAPGNGRSATGANAGDARGDRGQQLAAFLGNNGSAAAESLFAVAGTSAASPVNMGTLARAVSGVPGSGAAARAAEVLALQDARDAQPMSHMLLRIENGAGGEDRIRVDVRGQAVGATMLMDDAASAQQAASRVSELARALGARGLSADTLQVRAGGPATADLARILGAATADPMALRLPGTPVTLSSPHARGGGDAQASRQQSDPMRQRSRRQPNGGQS